VNAANSRNRARDPKNPQPFSLEDLIAAWRKSEERCAVSGLDFDLRVVGDGQARRPFAPSLDRIDRHKPYTRSNVRLVVSIANFAMNAWGEEPLRELASAVARVGRQCNLVSQAPCDDDLDDSAKTDADLVETSTGIVRFPPRTDLHQPILEMLARGPKSSWEIEKELARSFDLTEAAQKPPSGKRYSPWRYQVSFALVDLGDNPRGTGQVERVRTESRPDGGSMGIYRLRLVGRTAE
jgi:hypothetical protein